MNTGVAVNAVPVATGLPVQLSKHMNYDTQVKIGKALFCMRRRAKLSLARRRGGGTAGKLYGKESIKLTKTRTHSRTAMREARRVF